MNCKVYQQQISLLLDNELNIEDFPDLEKHLQQCSLCSATYNDFLDIDNEYQELTYPFPTDGISQQPVKHMMLSSSRRNVWTLVGAVFLAFVFGVLLTIAVTKSEKQIVYVVQSSNSEPINNTVEQLILYQQQQEWQKTKPLLKTLIYENEDTQVIAVAYFYLFEVYMKEENFSQAIKALRNFSKFTELNMMDQKRQNFEYSDTMVFVKDALNLAKELQITVKHPRDKGIVEKQVKNLELLSKGKIF